MEITSFSRNNIYRTFKSWDVPREFAEPMYNYLVFGFSPGGCFTSVLANDFHGAMHRSHPANTVDAFKALSGWIRDHVPTEARGSYAAVQHWCTLDQRIRRGVLEQHRLILTEQDEIWAALQGHLNEEVVLY